MEATHFTPLNLTFVPYSTILNVMTFTLRQQLAQLPKNAMGAS